MVRMGAEHWRASEEGLPEAATRHTRAKTLADVERLLRTTDEWHCESAFLIHLFVPDVSLKNQTAAGVGSRRWLIKTGRDDWIRTSDLTHPKRAGCLNVTN